MMKINTKTVNADTSDLNLKNYIIGECDDCATHIASGDKYLKLSDSLFCEAHTCMLSEIIEEVQLCVDQGHVMELYKTLHEQKSALQMMHIEYLENGDRKFISSK